jgi:hypothetical protein
LLAEVTWARLAATDAEADDVAAMLATETSALGVVVPWDSATLCVKDAEYRATLMEGMALERVSRAEADNTVALASAHEDAEGFVRKILLLEDELTVEHQVQEVPERESRAQFKELTLLQT